MKLWSENLDTNWTSKTSTVSFLKGTLVHGPRSQAPKAESYLWTPLHQIAHIFERRQEINFLSRRAHNAAYQMKVVKATHGPLCIIYRLSRSMLSRAVGQRSKKNGIHFPHHQLHFYLRSSRNKKLQNTFFITQ